MRRRNLRAEIFISARVKIVDRVLQPVRLALPRGVVAVQGGEVDQV